MDKEMAQYIPVVSCLILTSEAEPARFSISIFGLPKSHFLTIPGGSDEIKEALKLQRLSTDDYQGTLWGIKEVPSTQLQPPKYNTIKQKVYIDAYDPKDPKLDPNDQVDPIDPLTPTDPILTEALRVQRVRQSKF